MRTVIRKTSIHTVQKADQIEQRSDVWIRLAIVITEQAFVVPDQARIYIRSIERKIVRESSIKCKFKSSVKATCTTEAAHPWVAASLIFGVAVRTSDAAGSDRLSRIEQEVAVAVIKRTIFDN